MGVFIQEAMPLVEFGEGTRAELLRQLREVGDDWAAAD